jgi:hypothetical protein
MLARTQAKVMSDRKKVPKKKLLKVIIKLIAPLFLILGIFVGIIYLGTTYPPCNGNEFTDFLILWLGALEFNIAALYIIYLFKDDLRSSITKRRLGAIKKVKIMTTIAHIITAISIFGGGLVLASYLIYLRAVASGLTKITAPLTSQQAILTILLLILLPIPAYVVKRETVKAIRLGMGNATSA